MKRSSQPPPIDVGERAAADAILRAHGIEPRTLREGLARRHAERLAPHDAERRAANSKARACSSCGRNFLSLRAKNGRWPATCSVVCRLRSLDRLIKALGARRDKLAAEIDHADLEADRALRRHDEAEERRPK